MSKGQKINTVTAFTAVFSLFLSIELACCGQQALAQPNIQAIRAMSASQQQKDPYAEKYAGTAEALKKMESALKTAQGVLSGDQLTYFQSRLDTLKQTAASDVANGGDGSAFAAPMQSLQSELSSAVEQTKQSLSQNKLSLTQAIERLHRTYSERCNQLSPADQNQISDMIADFESRVGLVDYSSLDSAQRISTLTLEAATLENTIIGRTLIRPSYSPQRDSRPNVARNDEAQDKQAPVDASGARSAPTGNSENAIYATKEKTLQPLVETPKIPINTLIENIESQIKALCERGVLGTFEQEDYDKRLAIQKKASQSLADQNGKLSNAEDASIRAELEQMKKELQKK